MCYYHYHLKDERLYHTTGRYTGPKIFTHVRLTLKFYMLLLFCKPIIWLFDILILNVPHESYSKNTSCAVNFISSYLLALSFPFQPCIFYLTFFILMIIILMMLSTISLWTSPPGEQFSFYIFRCSIKTQLQKTIKEY